MSILLCGAVDARAQNVKSKSHRHIIWGWLSKLNAMQQLLGNLSLLGLTWLVMDHFREHRESKELRETMEPVEPVDWDEKSFLQEGFFLQWDERRDFLAWGKSHSSNKPEEGRFSCYLPDFYGEIQEPWLHFEYGGLFERSLFDRGLFGRRVFERSL